MHICVCLCVYIHVYVCLCLYMYVCTYIHTQEHIYIICLKISVYDNNCGYLVLAITTTIYRQLV